jgi:hypothetical protein
MANTEVVLRDEMGLRVPSNPKVVIADGDTITFTVEEGADSALYFDAATASVLSPKPGSRVDLAFGQPVTYTFTAAGSGPYGVVTQAPGDPAPESSSSGEPTSPASFVIRPGVGSSFPVQSNTPQH